MLYITAECSSDLKHFSARLGAEVELFSNHARSLIDNAEYSERPLAVQQEPTYDYEQRPRSLYVDIMSCFNGDSIFDQGSFNSPDGFRSCQNEPPPYKGARARACYILFF